MRVLVVEDEHKIAQSIKKGLEQEAFAVDLAYTGSEGFDLAAAEEYEVIVLDLMLPDKDGLTICKELRAENIHTPILILTAKGQLEDKVNGLNTGADDYLTKPFAFEELLARIRALVRRPVSTLTTTLKVEDLAIDSLTFSVTRSGKNIHLSSKEYALLEYLMRHPNQTLSKSHIIGHVWDYDADILENTVEVYIGYLRNKIDRAFPKLPPLIQTIRGFGYRIGLE